MCVWHWKYISLHKHLVEEREWLCTRPYMVMWPAAQNKFSQVVEEMCIPTHGRVAMATSTHCGYGAFGGCGGSCTASGRALLCACPPSTLQGKRNTSTLLIDTTTTGGQSFTSSVSQNWRIQLAIHANCKNTYAYSTGVNIKDVSSLTATP